MPQPPVIERIAQAIEARLKAVHKENGFQSTVREVVRPTSLGTFRPDDYTVAFAQAERVRNEGQSIEGNPYRYAWDQNFSISLFLSPSEKDCTPIDALSNVFGADIEKALTTDPRWPHWGELAIDSQIDPPEPFVVEEGPLTGAEGINVNLIVTYRTPFNDPFTASG